MKLNRKDIELIAKENAYFVAADCQEMFIIAFSDQYEACDFYYKNYPEYLFTLWVKEMCEGFRETNKKTTNEWIKIYCLACELGIQAYARGVLN